MHICIMIKEHMYMHRAYMHHVYMHQSQGLSMHDKYAASWIHASYTHVSGSRIIDVCITHVYMYQGPGSKGTYTCIIHACIRIMYKCTRHASYIYAWWIHVSRIYAWWIHVSRIHASQIHASQIHASRMHASLSLIEVGPRRGPRLLFHIFCIINIEVA